MSPRQLFLLRCRQGKIIKECDLSDFSEMFNKICDFVGLRFYTENESTESCIKFSQLLKDFWPQKHIKEILGAYFLGIKGDLQDLENNTIKVFPMIDIRTCSDLVNAFDRYFKKQFEAEMKSQKFWYSEPEHKVPIKEKIEESFRNGLAQALEIVKSGQKYDVAGTDLFLFSELKQRGIILITDEEAEAEIQEALKVFKLKSNLERYDQRTTIGRKVDLKKMIESVLPGDVRVKNIARRKILNDYLESWALTGYGVNDILK
jgi:hypothetical protein